MLVVNKLNIIVQTNNRKKLLTGQRLKTVKIEIISLKKLDSRAAGNGRELLRDGVHRVPETG